MKISESSEFTIPLKNLFALIGVTALSVWAYFGVTERLSFIEHKQELMLIEIEENDDWIDGWKPPASVQENIKKVREIEIELAEINLKLRLLLGRQYK